LRVLVDTSLLLNDYFHRHPEDAMLRGGSEPPDMLLKTWEISHEALLALSLRGNVDVCLAEYSALRLASILSDLRLGAEKVLDELRYWNSNFRLLALSPGEAELALETGLQLNVSSTRPAEDYLLTHLARQYEATYILSPIARTENMLQSIPFYQPEHVLKELGHLPKA
jgi:hypothetical protein